MALHGIGPVRRAPLARRLAALAAVSAVIALGHPASAGAATEVETGDAAEFAAAWVDPATTSIALTSDIVLDCDTAGAVRTAETDLVVEGGDHTITLDCPDVNALEEHGPLGGVTLRDLTFEATSPSEADAIGIVSDGDEAAFDVERVTIRGFDAAFHVSGLGPDLNLSDSEIVGNVTGVRFGGGNAMWGGGVSVVDSLIAENGSGIDGERGAEYNVELVGSTVQDNTGVGATTGGDGVLRVDSSTISGNGGRGVSGFIASVINSTITGNDETGISGVFLSVRFATIVGNGTDDGFNLRAEELDIGTSVFGSADGTANCDDIASVRSTGFNWADDESCRLRYHGDVMDPGGDPGLAPLADVGGGTATMLPATDSPLVDAVADAELCVADPGYPFDGTDQRGVERPQGTTCDVGAVERMPDDPGTPQEPEPPQPTEDPDPTPTPSPSTDPDADDPPAPPADPVTFEPSYTG